jgi:hypothetical protein
MGLLSTTFTGNVPGFDILAASERSRTIPVHVKTIKAGSWQFDARDYLVISRSEEIQKVKGKNRLENLATQEIPTVI